MTRYTRVGKMLLLTVLLAATLCLMLPAALADDCGEVHKGPFEYKVLKEPTCTVDGEREKWCKNCNTFIGIEPIVAIGHKWKTTTETTDSTCITQGTKITRTFCEVCGEETSRVTEYLPLADHKWAERDVKAATCTEEGIRQTYCTVCGTATNAPIPALDHKWGPWGVPTAATCEEPSKQTRICQNDSSHVQTQTVGSPLGHKWDEGQITTAPTCTAKGVKTFTCQNDPSHKRYEEVAPTGHKWDEGTITTAPTCEAKGVKTFTCVNGCGSTRTEEVAPIGHKWDAGTVTTQPTCEGKGVKTFTCTNGCGKVKTEDVAPIGHKWDAGKVTTDPTCEGKGVKTFTCQNDASHTKTEEVAPIGHKWDEGKVITAPTCETAGKMLYTCQNNAAHTKEETVAALGHNWDAGIVTKAATMTEEGERVYTCKTDPTHKKTEVIPKISLNNNTLCAFGPRLRDSRIYSAWYMFTPFDASKEGKQTFELVASNMYIVGTVTLEIRNDTLTVDYKVNGNTLNVTLEFFTVLGSMDDISRYEPEDLLAMNMRVRQPINLTEKFGDDRNLVLYFCSRCDYTVNSRFTSLNYNSNAHQRLVSEMLAMMD